MLIKHGGRDIEVDPVEIVEAKEPWCEYVLKDGTTLRVRNVLGAVFRTRQKNENGEPVYLTRSQNVAIATAIPENLLEHK